MQKNTVIFLVASFLILVGWLVIQRWLSPPQPAKPQPAQEAKKEEKPAEKKPAEQKPDEQKLAEQRSHPALAPPAPRRTHSLVTLGDENSYLHVVLDPRGGGVRS